jgi:hypothetical protein
MEELRQIYNGLNATKIKQKHYLVIRTRKNLETFYL